jgi:hypothetical protein
MSDKNYHNKGEQDAASGKFDPPPGITPLDPFIHTDRTLEKVQENREQYDAGHKNARDQK